MARETKAKHPILSFIAVLVFTLFYPMLISIYVFLPLFIGTMSYLLIRGLKKNRLMYLFFSIIYLINLEVNLSLPLFLTIIGTLLFYVTLYPYLRHFRRCNFCKPLLSVILLDVLYLGALFGFDFIFQTESIVLDNILLYSLVVDMLMVVLL